MNTPDIIYCLEITLMPLSELVIRQVGKSNVRWFTYPFIPPTTLSGFLHSVIFKDDPRNFIERDDAIVRRLEDEFKGIYCLGAYPPIKNGNMNIHIGKHYRQHFGDKFNYESFVWDRNQNKKLAVVEYFWVDILKGYVVSKKINPLKRVSEKIMGGTTRIGKKGSIQIIDTSIYTMNLEKDGTEWCSGFVPVHKAIEFSIDSRIYIIPTSSRKGVKNNKRPKWKLIPVIIGAKINAPYYKDCKKNIVFPIYIFDFVSQ